MSLKKLIVCHFVLTAAPPDSIWLAGAAIHRLRLLGESTATMRKTIPAADCRLRGFCDMDYTHCPTWRHGTDTVLR